MGNQISSAGHILPISAASIFIGFVSFIFTLATALRVFWNNLRTIGAANREVQDLIPNLKQSLYEERAHLRLIRRRCKAQYEEAAFRVLADSVRHMISDFKFLEKPFLVEQTQTSRARDRSSTQFGTGKPAARRDRDYALELGAVDSSDDYYLVNYRASSLGQRVIWLKTRSSFISLSNRLDRVQTRRIARQQADLAIDARYLASAIGDMQDRIDGIEQKLSRAVGLRRGD